MEPAPAPARSTASLLAIAFFALSGALEIVLAWEMIRDFIFKLGTSLAVMKCTTLLTSEVPPQTFKFSQYEIEEFISDGILFLGDVERKGDLIRTLQIIKMRGTAF